MATSAGLDENTATGGHFVSHGHRNPLSVGEMIQKKGVPNEPRGMSRAEEGMSPGAGDAGISQALLGRGPVSGTMGVGPTPGLLLCSQKQWFLSRLQLAERGWAELS